MWSVKPVRANNYFQQNYRQWLKGHCHEILCLWLFSWISFPPAPEYSIRTISNFFESSRRYPQVKVPHRYQRHRWQIMGTISGCRHLKVNLKAKIYIYVNITTQRCQNKRMKIFLIDYFFHFPPVSTTPVVHLELRISPRILEKKFETALMVYSGAWGKLIHEKNQRSKISWHCPFKSL